MFQVHEASSQNNVPCKIAAEGGGGCGGDYDRFLPKK
jgi:hypothetical protein